MHTLGGAIGSGLRGATHDAESLIDKLLTRRGLCDEESVRRFLEPNYDEHLHDPFLLTDMEKAVERILRAMREDEHIVIYTDYDCDGIPGGVLLHDFFTAIQYTNFENYIPHRHEEGYGFNAASVPGFKERKATLIITVDCGITDHAGVERANELGIDVIVTDHHEPAETLPLAYAVINPKRDDAYPFKGICGTTVAYKLALATLTRGRETGQITLKEGMEKWWLDLVALATVADMVPLIDENRVLVHYGLQVLRKSKRPGLQQLLRIAGGDQRFITEDDIGFTIAPRINAASRMDDPEDAFHMLRTKDVGEAGTYAAHLERLNNERKGVVASMTKEAKRRMNELETVPPVIVFGNPEWRPSLAGLVANALAEEWKRPAFVWGRDANGTIKGSCRSEGVTSVVALMEHAREAFSTFGGHHASGGFSVDHAQVHRLAEMLGAAYEVHGASCVIEHAENVVDAVLTLEMVNGTLMRTLNVLAPFGEANPKPLFAFEDVVPQAVAVFGKTKNHTKLVFDIQQGKPLEAIAFFKLPEHFRVVPAVGKEVTLFAHVETSYFMGRQSTRLRIVDIV